MGWAYAATKDNLPATIAYEDEANTFTTGPQMFDPPGGVIAFIARGNAVINLAEYRRISDNALFSSVGPEGDLNAPSLAATLGAGGSGTQLRLQSPSDVVIGSVRGTAGQTANLLNFESNAAAILASILASGAFNTVIGYNRSGTQVVGAQGAAVADAAGGVTIDAEGRAAINALLARVRTHGLIAP